MLTRTQDPGLLLEPVSLLRMDDRFHAPVPVPGWNRYSFLRMDDRFHAPVPVPGWNRYHSCGWTIAFRLRSRCLAGTGIIPADGRLPSRSRPGLLLEPVLLLRMDDRLHAPVPLPGWNQYHSCGWMIAFGLPSRCRAGTGVTPADGRSPSGFRPGAGLEPVSLLRMDDRLRTSVPVPGWNRYHSCGWMIAFTLPPRSPAGTGITPADGRSPSCSCPGLLLEPVSLLRMDDRLHAPAPVSCWNRYHSCGWTIAFRLPSRCRAVRRNPFTVSRNGKTWVIIPVTLTLPCWIHFRAMARSWKSAA